MTTYRVPSRVAHVVPEEQAEPPAVIYLMQLPDDEPLVLHHSAAWIWLAAAHGEEDVTGVVGELVGRPRVEIESDVEDFLDELVGRGLLDERPLAGS